MRNASSALIDARTKLSAATERFQYEEEDSTHDVRNITLLKKIGKENRAAKACKRASLAAG